MDNDPGIVCYKHCGDRNVFCIKLPSFCHVCKQHVSDSLFIPIRVCYPFARASQHPCSVVFKPTNGDFLKNYRLMDDLHIGITTSKGVVVSYDCNGVVNDDVNTDAWQQCLVVYRVEEASWETQWDNVLMEIARADFWTKARYNEDTHNCLSFVVEFVKRLGMLKTCDRVINTREEFTDTFIAPATVNAQKYIHLYRKIVENGFYVYNSVSNEIVCS
ncbi:MKRN2 opposite strand protein isoform X2 [Adelges cooleyi]|uniref:MKRN2 opposite strand protein isoform X2 n=1 Tax=Adelges cooleyi TaxID=133065 RepID=UPI0021809200|nr:MKRN2 opposite strand protein isoform X2 [Adelges cooleyi]